MKKKYKRLWKTWHLSLLHSRNGKRRMFPMMVDMLKNFVCNKKLCLNMKFITKFVADVQILRQHESRITSQYVELDCLKHNMEPQVEARCQLDYAENYSCKFQNEPSQVFYDRNQVSIFPVVIYYRDSDGMLQELCWSHFR